MHLRTHTHIYTRLSTPLYLHTHTLHSNVPTYLNTHIYLFPYMRTHAVSYIRMYALMGVRVRVFVCVSVYVCVSTYTYIYTQVDIYLFPSISHTYTHMMSPRLLHTLLTLTRVNIAHMFTYTLRYTHYYRDIYTHIFEAGEPHMQTHPYTYCYSLTLIHISAHTRMGAWTHTHTHIHFRIHFHIHSLMLAYTRKYTHTHFRTKTLLYQRTYTYLFSCFHTHMNTHACTHTHTHTQTQRHTWARVCLRTNRPPLSCATLHNTTNTVGTTSHVICYSVHYTRSICMQHPYPPLSLAQAPAVPPPLTIFVRLFPCFLLSIWQSASV